MSGHTDFTLWIKNKAKYILDKDGNYCKIKSTFFTSSPVHNSDEFIIETDKGSFALDEIDYDELIQRSNK